MPSENLNKEKEILRAQALNEGKPEKIVERMVELRGNLEEARTLCQLTHQREQLKLKKLLYICETVVEVHYLLTKHSGARPLTYNVVVCNAFLTRS